jgi:hypothetical protein
MLCGGLTRGEVFVIVIPDSVNVILDSVNVILDLIRDPWIAGQARNDKFEGCNEKFEGCNEKSQARNDQAVMTAFV